MYRIYFSQRSVELKHKVDGWMVIYSFVNIAADHDVVQRALWSQAVDSERLNLLYPPIIQKCSLTTSRELYQLCIYTLGLC